MSERDVLVTYHRRWRKSISWWFKTGHVSQPHAAVIDDGEELTLVGAWTRAGLNRKVEKVILDD